MVKEPGEAFDLEGFHAGDRGVLAACYHDQYPAVEAALRSLLAPADKETIIHDVFLALISEEGTRRSFRGGSLRSWLCTLARNRAIDYLRRHGREQSLSAEAMAELPGQTDAVTEARAHARRLLGDFQRDHLPSKWRGVFEQRFLRQLSQREAAAALGISRTTLAYQESRVRRLLRRYLLLLEE